MQIYPWLLFPKTRYVLYPLLPLDIPCGKRLVFVLLIQKRVLCRVSTASRPRPGTRTLIEARARAPSVSIPFTSLPNKTYKSVSTAHPRAVSPTW